MMNRIATRFGAAASFAAIALGMTTSPVLAADNEALLPLAYLGLTAAEGKTEADSGAGKTEINQLTAALMGNAATAVWSDVVNKAKGKIVLPVAGTSQVDLKPYYFVRMRQAGIMQNLESMRPIKCKAPGAPKDGNGNKAAVDGAEGATLDTSASALLQTGFALLKNDVKLAGIDAAISDEFVINAIAGASAKNSAAKIILAQDLQAPGANYTSTLWNNHLGLINGVNQLAKAGCEKDPVNGAMFAYVKGQVTEISSGEKDKPSLLEQAMLMESVAEKSPLILRLKLENANGTMITVKNVWTTIGAEALRFRAGLALSYRLTDPQSGELVTAGTVRCNWKPIGFRSIEKAVANIANLQGC